MACFNKHGTGPVERHSLTISVRGNVINISVNTGAVSSPYQLTEGQSYQYIS